MIRIAICDDEKKILDEVSGYIKIYAEKKSKEIEVFRFDSAAPLIGALEDGKSFDIFVLDVYIRDERGTVLARDIRKLGISDSTYHLPCYEEVGGVLCILGMHSHEFRIL